MNFQKKNKLIIVLALLLLVGFGGYKYLMRPPISTISKKVDFSGYVSNFIDKARENPTKWSGKIVVLEGSVTSKDGLGIKLNEKIYCQFSDSSFASLKRNESVKVKGFFLGYDDLMDEFSVNECIILE